MSKKRARIRIKKEYHDVTMSTLRDMAPFEAEPESEPVLMRHVCSESGWQAIEVGVLEKAAASPRKFAVFAKLLDACWHTNGRVNGSNLRAAVHTAAYRLKAHHEETIALIGPALQSDVANLKSELRRSYETKYAALAEQWRCKALNLDALAPELKLKDSENGRCNSISAFLGRNPGVAQEIPQVVEALVRVEMVSDMMRFDGPPKRMISEEDSRRQSNEAEAADSLESEPNAETKPNQAKPASKPTASPARSQEIGGRPAESNHMDVLIASGKIAEHQVDGEQGFALTFKAPTGLAGQMSELGLVLVDFPVGGELRQRYWGRNVAQVAKAVELTVAFRKK